MTASKLFWLGALMALFWGAGGCASVPRPVPAGLQALSSMQVAGVTVHVPRLDPGDYPSDVLEVMTPVLVVIENRSAAEILIDPEGFVLSGPDGMQYAPLRPEQLALKDTVPAEQKPVLLARGGRGGFSIGRGVGGFRSAPAFRGGHGGFRVSPPGFRPGAGYHRPGYFGRSGYGYRSGFRGRGGAYVRPWWGWNYPWLWGAGWGMSWYGSPWWWENQGVSDWTRSDAAQMALPSGRLPAGGRTGGFIYFPKIAGEEGAPLNLTWRIRDSSGQQVLGDVQLPLELSEQQ